MCIERKLMEKLVEIRKEKGINQKQVAKHLNLHSSTISSYEQGKRAISINHLKEYCALLEIKVWGLWQIVEMAQIVENQEKKYEWVIM